MSGKIPRGEALLRRMSGASPTRCLTSPATLTPSATHNFLYKTSKTAPKGAVFLIFSAIVITVFCCNNDVLLEKLSDIQKPLSQLHVRTILPDIKNGITKETATYFRKCSASTLMIKSGGNVQRAAMNGKRQSYSVVANGKVDVQNVQNRNTVKLLPSAGFASVAP